MHLAKFSACAHILGIKYSLFGGSGERVEHEVKSAIEGQLVAYHLVDVAAHGWSGEVNCIQIQVAGEERVAGRRIKGHRLSSYGSGRKLIGCSGHHDGARTAADLQLKVRLAIRDVDDSIVCNPRLLLLLVMIVLLRLIRMLLRLTRCQLLSLQLEQLLHLPHQMRPLGKDPRHCRLVESLR